jgi:hypothetical protein
MKSFLIRMDDDKHKDLKIWCAEQELSLQEFFMKAAEDYRKKLEVPK